MTYRYRLIRHDISRVAEKALLAVIWRLPRTLVYWCAIRVGAAATTGQYGTTEPPKLLFMEALERWRIQEPEQQEASTA